MKVPVTPFIVLLGLTSLLVVASPSDARRKSRELRAAEAQGVSPGTTPGQLGTAAAGEQVLGEWDFEDGVGGPDAQGWTTHDNTVPPGPFTHVDDFAGLGVPYAPLQGTKSLWCGLRPGDCAYAMLPGYGNRWDDRFESIPLATTGDVIVDFVIRYDTEAGYDFVTLEYRSVSDIWHELSRFEGNNQTIAEETIPADSLAGATQLRFRFRSDPGYSDEDGLINTSGAFVLDSLRVRDDTGVVNLQLFELEEVGAQTTVDGTWSVTSAPAYGNYAGLFDGATVLQEDPLVTNTTHLWGFFNGSTHNFDCGGHPEQLVVPYMKTMDGAELFIDNEIRSPMISLTEDINGEPVTENTFKLVFDVYRDLPQDPVVFYTFNVRSYVAGCWGAWKNHGFVYWGAGKDWLRASFDVTGEIDPGATHIQASIGVVDNCWAWCGVYGNGECHTHAPLIDNVAVLATTPTLEVTNTLNSGSGSLRQAITDANQDPNVNRIEFNIPGAGLQTINLSTALPLIQEPVIIDGTTQPGYAGTPLVRIQGTSLPINSSLLRLLGGDSEVRGLSLYEVSQAGILLQSDNNVVEGCTFESCTAGVEVSGNANRVGGVIAGQGNHFTNYFIAVQVNSGIENVIRGNEMTSAWVSGMGIDLYPSFVTPNDPLDSDFGANQLQNHPALTEVDGTQGTIAGSLDSAPNETFAIDFYTAWCGTNGRSAGELLLGSMEVATNGSGHVDFVASLAPFPAAAPITATATDASGNTSEFARCFVPLVVTNVADAGAGSLRQAILDTNTSPDPNTILFQISGGGPFLIVPATPLPPITSRVTINGYSQAGATPNTSPLGEGLNATIMIELDGSSLATGSGIILATDSCVVRGLVINGFPEAGIGVASNRCRIEGCYIGTDVTGTVARPNENGVELTGSSNSTVGGVGPGRNLISGNTYDGIRILWGASTVVQGSLVGLTADGNAALGNGFAGIRIYNAPEITIMSNVVSGNGQSGVTIINVVTGIGGTQFLRNLIGTDPAGSSPVGNGLHGIEFSSATGIGDPIVVGGSITAGNVVAYNAGSGIQVALPYSGQRATISYNTIHSNASGIVVENGVATILSNRIGPNSGMGIDLGGDGVTANDPSDADIGPNGLQNYPILTAATPLPNGTIRISGTLNSAPSQNHTVQFFRSSSCDPTGHGEGEIFIGLSSVVTDASGTRNFTISGFPNLPGGTSITATANPTTQTGTSEFSPCVVYLNTIPGANVISVPVDEETGESPVTLVFDNVTGAGNVLLSTSVMGPPPPGGLTFGDDPTFYDLTTSATFTGSIDVCIDYDESLVAGLESDLRVLHYDDTLVPPDWVDITASVDTVANVLCGTTTSLSPFAIAEPVQATAIGDALATPTEFALLPCAPNPFNPITTIRYDIPGTGAHVQIAVFDVTGRRVRTLVDRAQPGGRQSVTWDGRDDRGRGVASGVYFYRLSAGDFVQTRKMVLLK